MCGAVLDGIRVWPHGAPFGWGQALRLRGQVRIGAWEGGGGPQGLCTKHCQNVKVDASEDFLLDPGWGGGAFSTSGTTAAHQHSRAVGGGGRGGGGVLPRNSSFCMTGGRAGAANTFNNIERVYSKAIAFSNRRCSVPLESMLPTS